MRVPRIDIPEFAPLNVVAFTTTRDAGSFGTTSDEAVSVVMDRWYALHDELREHGDRLATARQVHGTEVVTHADCWSGWLRVDCADGHLAANRGTALAVTVADCVPIFMAHPAGEVALLHSGWRGTAAGILDRALDAFQARGRALSDLVLHLGPAICGGCYEVSPDVHARLTGREVPAPASVDLRALLADRARSRGVTRVTVSAYCTRCDNDRLFSHRAGDSGRQLGVIVAAR
ncbi:MAG TPA: polyphenol oxidase family protein [Gemmatimonadaceae bacterium]|nr:polyphenol oxidase family protein [Gemmatimonadaceae bacterium]